MPTCINLKELLGRRYRVTYEESYRADHGPGARTADPWLMIVPCRYGHIFPHGGQLAGCLRRWAPQCGQRVAPAALLSGAPSWRLWRTDGVVRHGRLRQGRPDHASAAAPAGVGGRTRAAGGQGAKFKFRPGVESDLAVRGCVPATQVDVGAIGGAESN